MPLNVICTAMRVLSLVAVGLMNIREYIPGSVDYYKQDTQLPPPMTDQMRYDQGEIWWCHNRDDLSAIGRKIAACAMWSVNGTTSRQKIGCFLQGRKEHIKYMLIASMKSYQRFVVELFTFRHEDLMGSSPLWPTIKLLGFLGLLAISIAKIYANRGLIRMTLVQWLKIARDFIMPAPPTIEPAATYPYMSKAAKNVLQLLKDNPDVSFQDMFGPRKPSSSLMHCVYEREKTMINYLVEVPFPHPSPCAQRRVAPTAPMVDKSPVINIAATRPGPQLRVLTPNNNSPRADGGARKPMLATVAARGGVKDHIQHNRSAAHCIFAAAANEGHGVLQGHRSCAARRYRNLQSPVQMPGPPRCRCLSPSHASRVNRRAN